MTASQLEKIDSVIEYLFYALIVFIFMSKGESIRNILIFGSSFLWIISIRYRKDLYLLKNNIFFLCLIYFGITVLLVIFSIDRLYSFKQIFEEPLKFILLVPVISTVMADERRLKRSLYVICAASILLLVAGYYSYLFENVYRLTPDTTLYRLHYNRFSRYLNTLLPFTYALYFVIEKKNKYRYLIAVLFFLAIVAQLLTTSRTGIGVFVIIFLVWSFYIAKLRDYDFKKIVVLVASLFLIVGILSYNFSGEVKKRTREITEDFNTFNLRTRAWLPAIAAIRNRPVTGWGYGARTFFMKEPYSNTEYDEVPPIKEHNTILYVLFHQGIVGLIPYLLLMVVTMYSFWRKAFEYKGDIRGYILVACFTVFIGNYVLHGLMENMPDKLYHMAIVIGLGLASIGVGKKHEMVND
jgi:O-antigen ligase